MAASQKLILLLFMAMACSCGKEYTKPYEYVIENHTDCVLTVSPLDVNDFWLVKEYEFVIPPGSKATVGTALRTDKNQGFLDIHLADDIIAVFDLYEGEEKSVRDYSQRKNWAFEPSGYRGYYILRIE